MNALRGEDRAGALDALPDGDGNLILIDPNPSPQAEARDFSIPNELDKLSIHDKRSDIAFKKKYFQITQKITYRWSCFIMAAVAAQIVLNAAGHGLSDASFIALITTTTTTLLGFWYLIGRYLFPQNKS